MSGYRVYYGSASGDRAGTGATEGNSGFNVTTASATVSGLTTTVATPATPTLNPTRPLNESLELSWSAVPSAKSYNVYYGTTSPPGTLAATVNTPSYTLTGLTNGQTYYVAVSAVNQAIYYFTVTAFDSFGATTGPYGCPRCRPRERLFARSFSKHRQCGGGIPFEHRVGFSRSTYAPIRHFPGDIRVASSRRPRTGIIPIPKYRHCASFAINICSRTAWAALL